MFKIQLFFFRLIYHFLKIGYPFGILKWANHDKYEKIFNDAKNKVFERIDKFEEQKKYKINLDWLNDLALTTQVVIKKSPINYQHGRLLYSELSNYLNSLNSSAEPYIFLC